jgi:hypothetical protein
LSLKPYIFAARLFEHLNFESLTTKYVCNQRYWTILKTNFQNYTKIFFVKYVRSGSGPTIPDQSRPRSSESGSTTLVLGPASELEEH